MKVYKVGDIVDIKANGSIQKGMPHKYYHGKTGIVYNVTKSSVGVIINKVVGNRYIEKRVNLRVEHVKHSACRQEFLNRVKSNAAKKREAKANGETVYLKDKLPSQEVQELSPLKVTFLKLWLQSLTKLSFKPTIPCLLVFILLRIN